MIVPIQTLEPQRSDRWTRRYVVECDGCGLRGPERGTATVAKAYAESAGYVFTMTGVRCPGCARKEAM